MPAEAPYAVDVHTRAIVLPIARRGGIGRAFALVQKQPAPLPVRAHAGACAKQNNTIKKSSDRKCASYKPTYTLVIQPVISFNCITSDFQTVDKCSPAQIARSWP